MKSFRSKRNSLLFLLAAALLINGGCGTKSYPADQLKASLLKICQEEYGIEELDVKITGNTIGVYLPLKKLFASDFKEAVVSGKIRNLETLFEPSPEALDKVEDVLFTISRIILSTDKPIDFYVLKATDVEKTGLQLVLTGNVNDIKRVRVWDISRNEYRKRVTHELMFNQAVVWHQPVRKFFSDLKTLTAAEIQAKYFGNALSEQMLQKLFFDTLLERKDQKPKIQWEVLDLRSTAVDKAEGVVYAKVKARGGQDEPAIPPAIELEYLFMVSAREDHVAISRIIPFQYRDDYGNWNKISFPKELQMEENLANWQEEFPLEEVRLGDFLANQLTRRLEAIMAGDERIHNTFQEAKLKFKYHEEDAPAHFSLDMEQVALRDFNNYRRSSILLHEDMLYLLNLAFQEFVTVLRSYQFGDYEHLILNSTQETASWTLGRNELELFRRKKIDLQGLLSFAKL